MLKREDRRLTPSEALIMDVLWEKSPISVRQVQEQLRHKKDMAYNTVLTMMRILREKGFLRSQRQGRTDFYEPTITRREVGKRSLGDVLNLFFAGSAGNLVSHLLDQERISADELTDIRRAIDEKLEDAND